MDGKWKSTIIFFSCLVVLIWSVYSIGWHDGYNYAHLLLKK